MIEKEVVEALADRFTHPTPPPNEKVIVRLRDLKHLPASQIVRLFYNLKKNNVNFKINT